MLTSQLGIWTLPRSIAIAASLLVDRRLARVALPLAAAASEIYAGSPFHVALIAAGLFMTLGYLLTAGLDLVPGLPRITARLCIGALGLAITAVAECHPLPALLAAALLARDTTVRYHCFRRSSVSDSGRCSVCLLCRRTLAWFYSYPPGLWQPTAPFA